MRFTLYKILISFVTMVGLPSCGSRLKITVDNPPQAPHPLCVDVDLSQVSTLYEVTRCDGTKAFGSLDITNLKPDNVKSGIVIAGVVGEVIPTPANCSGDDRQNCVASGDFYAGRVCSEDGSACFIPEYVSGSQDMKAIKFSSIDSTKMLSSLTIAGVTGSLVPQILNASQAFPGAGYFVGISNTPSSSDIVSGVGVLGVTGNITLPTTNRVLSGTSYGASGAMVGMLTLPNASNVLSGTGAYGDPSMPVSPAMPSAVLNLSQPFPGAGYYTNIVAAPAQNNYVGTILGQPGSAILESHINCTADGSVGCVTVPEFKAADMALVTATNIKKDITIAGVTGSTIPTPIDCTLGGQQQCVATGLFFAGLTCSEGDSACYVPEYSVMSQPLQAVNYNNIDPTKMLSSLTVAGVSGSIAVRGSFDLSQAFPGAGYYTGITTVLGSSKVLAGYSILGQVGSVVAETHTPCDSNFSTNCVANSNFVAADLSEIHEGVIKTGVTVAGVEGRYPSAMYPLPGSSGVADLKSSFFDLQIKSSLEFEYWDSTGSRNSGFGSTDILSSNIAAGKTIFGTAGSLTSPDPWDLRAGKSVVSSTGTVSGKLKINCRNGVDPNALIYNYDGDLALLPNTGITNGGVFDVWDTIDNYGGLKSTRALGWSTNTFCGGDDGIYTTGNGNWIDVTTNNDGVTPYNCAAHAGRCSYKDRISGLEWTPSFGVMNWANAVRACDVLDYNGKSDWRLPTQMELMSGYTNGIPRDKLLTLGSDHNWSATSNSMGPYDAWITNLRTGFTNGNFSKTTTAMVNCVR